MVGIDGKNENPKKGGWGDMPKVRIVSGMQDICLGEHQHYMHRKILSTLWTNLSSVHETCS